MDGLKLLHSHTSLFTTMDKLTNLKDYIANKHIEALVKGKTFKPTNLYTPYGAVPRSLCKQVYEDMLANGELELPVKLSKEDMISLLCELEINPENVDRYADMKLWSPAHSAWIVIPKATVSTWLNRINGTTRMRAEERKRKEYFDSLQAQDL